jgi:FtsP/CotA-like multicopper oxidase with cupredoxin domain
VRGQESEDGFTVLRAMKGTAPLMGESGDPTSIWAFEGQSPGPTLKVRQGEELKVRLINELPEPTTIHWHGIRLPNDMDGTHLTQEPVEPGGSFDYIFRPPDAGTFWYHPHIRSAEQVDRGLYGALIVEEKKATAGLSDVLMVLDDWWLLDSGMIDEATFGNLMIAAHAGRMGNWFTVNGTSRPRIAAPAGERLRLRLINTANARVMRLLIEGAEPHLLAVDGQPVPPRKLGAEPLILAPGGRADVGLPRGQEQIVLANEIQGEALEVAYIDRDGEAEPDAVRFESLPANPLPDSLELDKAETVPLVMQGGAMGGMTGASMDGREMSMRELIGHDMAWALNGGAGMPKEPLIKVRRGKTVAIAVENDTAWPHAMHLHGHHVRIVAEGEREVDDPAWRDTVLVGPRRLVKIAFLADNPGKWMLHCHMLEHQDTGMMTWIEVA